METVERDRYEELLAKEERLILLEKAVSKCNPYSGDLYTIKKIFCIDEEERKETEE